MASPIDRAQVLHVAKLARLTLKDEEVPVVTKELVDILAYVAQLSEVDVTGIEPTTQVGVDRMPFRPDEPREGVPHDRALAQAPDTAGGGFVVPSFVED